MGSTRFDFSSKFSLNKRGNRSEIEGEAITKVQEVHTGYIALALFCAYEGILRNISNSF